MWLHTTRLPLGWENQGDEGLELVQSCYEQLLSRNFIPAERDGEDHTSDPTYKSHNMIMTREWMVVAQRLCDADPTTGIGGNAVALAGFFLVKDDEQLEALKARGPGNALADLIVRRPWGH